MALYDDIGGAPAVRAILDAFYPRVLADAKLSSFFLGVDIEHFLAVLKSVLVDRGVPAEKIAECFAVFDGARSQILDR